MMDKLKDFFKALVISHKDLVEKNLTDGHQKSFFIKIGTDNKTGGHNNKGLQKKRRVVVN